ncbi:MAG: FHA domain-containing protein [Candidatus Wallbacteria bacterium]|nr:FHA domain-containing protein [Candidatus Wallbacteria bacterium]
MSSIEARGAEERERLQRQTRTGLGVFLLGLLVAAGVTAPAAWLVTGHLMSVPLTRTSFGLKSQRGEVLVQQTVARSRDEYGIYFTVTTPEGAPVRKLDRADVEVSSDELGPASEYELTPAGSDPLDLIVALSTSGSMGTAGRLDSVKSALKGWLRAAAPWRSALVTFGGQSRTEVDLETDVTRFQRALDRLAPHGGTALYDGVVQAAEQAWGKESRLVLLVVADEDDGASRSRPSDAWSRARGAGLPAFCVGVGDTVSRPALEELARKTGGRAFFAADVAALPGLLDSLGDLLASQHRVTVPAMLLRPGAFVTQCVMTALILAMLAAVYIVLRRWLLAPQLVVLGGPKHGMKVRLVSEILVCGSDSGCHLQVPGDVKTTLGRRFALERRGSTVSFHLLDASGATTVNRAVVESRDLVSGDIVRAGLARFLFFRVEPRSGGRPERSAAPAIRPERLTGPFWLVGDDGGPAFKIDGDRARVGREPDNEIVLEDPSVSRRHAEFVRTPEGVVMADLGSRNGTYLAESRVGSEAALHDGARLRFGRIKFTASRTPPGEEPSGFGELGEGEVSLTRDSSLDQTEDPAQESAPKPAAPVAEPVPPPTVPAPEPPSTDGHTPAVSPAVAEAAAAFEAEVAKASFPCPVCGHTNRAHARYCTQCGEKISGAPPAGSGEA